MLVLSRKREEKVNIYFNGKLLANLMIVEIRGDRVRLGFDFPKEYHLVRNEIDDGTGKRKEKTSTDS